ncbi:glycosyltransferase family 2 protein [Azospirillum canadense]|uniref:glycosyltransferase family 2 protein n=1 Tax=Azospirillum canadense TaxID=403962 RepID=UPI0022277731|nr:glycosyltransferase family 2 protein [Azospirillum canadense]MCW2236396.1 putative LPLAT superfamily acyltransferase [Azospirillum canadense]
MTDSFRPCAIVPSHNHWRAVGAVVAGLRAQGLPVFIIDDGSAEPARGALAALHDPKGGVTVRRLDANQGKGGAVMEGFRLALAEGFTHAAQVDADGQHDPDAVPGLLDLARTNLDALVTGVPVYDATIPRGRAIGRWVTHVWVWVETLSLRIRDSMCGFRVYPLAAVERLVASGERLGRRMDFDTEVMVRLFWRGTPVAELPVRVTYPPDNTSNFDLLRDNVRISLMHTRLVVSMLLRLPGILRNRPRRVGQGIHWAGLAERGMGWGLRFCAAAYRLLGRRACLAVIAPVILYFYLTGAEQRRASAVFLTRAFVARGEGRRPTWRDGFRHFLAFAGRALDSFAGWTGRLGPEAVEPGETDALREAAGRERGALFIVAHLGNVDLSRAVLDAATRRRLLVLVHTRHAENYNRLLRDWNPEAAVNTLQVTDIGPETAIALKERVEQGQWVVIAGDRVPVQSRGRVSLVPFLGEPAPFSQGPYILAALLDCPVYLLFCRRVGDRHRLDAEKLAERVVLPRGRREEALAGYAAAFAGRLEQHALADPYQWFNFFDFWARPEGSKAS